MNRHHIYNIVLGLAIGALTLASCADEWNDHYDGMPTSVSGETGTTLWEAIQKNSNLSNFATVIKACGYDKALNGSQVFTVFAPTNDSFSSAEAETLIQAYNAEKGKVSDDENTTIKEFLQNHIALYNYSVSTSSNDTITLMNGKYAMLTSNGLNGNHFLTTNQHYGNGVLFTLDNKVEFYPNLFEYLRKDADLDSLRSFFYNERFYRSVFQPSRSIPGGIVDGKTIYLDSVFRLENDLFDYDFLQADINKEDSVFWMLAPTNNVWRELVNEYANYFNYQEGIMDRDSLVYTNTRMAILNGTVFSRSYNSDAALRDSAMSTNAVYNYNYRQGYWGRSEFHYYQYDRPYDEGGAFSNTSRIECSNGAILKADRWNIDKKETFFRTRIIEAEGGGSIKKLGKIFDNNLQDSIDMVIPRYLSVPTDNSFHGQVSGNMFVEFQPVNPSRQDTVIFNIPEVLSDIGYDIYLVTAPALANDSNATMTQRLPTVIRATLETNAKGGLTKEVLVSSVETTPDVVDYILV